MTEPDTTTRTPVRPRTRPDVALSTVAIDFGTSSSTATFFDNAWMTARPLRPAQMAELSRRLMALLKEPGWMEVHDDGGAAVSAQLTDLVGDELRLLDENLARPAGIADLIVQLERDAASEESLVRNRYRAVDQGRPEERTHRMDAVCLAFERLMGRRPELADRLASKLQEAYDAAFGAASLESYNLTPAVMEEPDSLDVPSMVVMSHGDVGTARLRREPKDDEIGFSSLKRFVARPETVDAISPASVPAGWHADTDTLLLFAYRDLVERVERSVSVDPPYLKGHLVNRAAITYPTTTPPSARRRLSDILRDGLNLDVDITYDEGVAAALFFVMGELGGSKSVGVEALRARSRRTGPHSWQRTMLVVDIGGGTTDIALVSLDLTDLTDLTQPPAYDLLRGRHYLLRPRVLGTSGNAQLGGDLLTLKVFYWIKALLVDRLLADRSEELSALWQATGTEDPVPDQGLAAAVVRFRALDPVPIAVRDVLRAVLPTHTEALTQDEKDQQALQGGRAFRVLWQAAETAKRSLAAGRTHDLGQSDLTALKSALGTGYPRRGAFDALGEKRLSLDPADFALLARPVLDHAMGLGAALAKQRLATAAGGVLDVVALAGRTCGMPLAEQAARARLTSVLRDEGDHQAAVRWDPAALCVETTYAKQAASIGACWASTAKIGGSNTADGENKVEIAVDNLLLHLPCGFDIGGSEANQRAVLLHAGDALDRIEAGGKQYVESGFRPMEDEIYLHRRIDGGESVQWGKFFYQARADLERADLERAGGTASGPGRAARPADLTFSIRMDQALDPTILIRSGTEPFVIVDTTLPTMDVASWFRHQGTGDELQFVPQISARLLDGMPARPPGATPTPDGQELFRFTSAPGGGFDHWFRLLTADRPVRGAVAAAALPTPDDAILHGVRGQASLYYQLRLRTGPDSWEPLGDALQLPVPRGRDGGLTAYWATIDTHGRLRIVQGYPPYVPAHTLEEMRRAAGAVYAAPMDDALPDRRRVRDPFNGEH